MTLSARMKMNADLVPENVSVADIGCDHGYVAMYLATEKNCQKVIAMDVNPGPLSIARNNIKQERLQKIVECRLSDGMVSMQPGEVDVVLLAGMGGMLISRILQQSPDILDKVNTLILQPQSDLAEVRMKVFELGFRIDEERFCKEADKYYVAIRAVRGKETVPYTYPEFCYGRILPERQDKLYEQYLIEEMKKRKQLFSQLLQHETETAKIRKAQIGKEMEDLQQLLVKYNKVHKSV